MEAVIAENQSWEERDLLGRARGGDTEAFGELCRTQEPRLLRQAFLVCGDYALAEDLAQEALIEAWRCLRRYNGRCQLFTWLCAILLHIHRKGLRRRRAVPFSVLQRDERDDFQDRVAGVPADEALPDETAELKEQAASVRRCIAALPARHQQVIHLRFFVDDSIEGIAAALGCSEGTVKSRLYYALEKLRGMPALGASIKNSQTKSGAS